MTTILLRATTTTALLFVLLLLCACVTAATLAAEENRATTSAHTWSDLQSNASSPGTVVPNRASSANGPSSADVSIAPPTPPPRASIDSPTFRLVKSPMCNETSASLVMQVYSKNRALFDECVTKSKYQIFPFPGELPTPAQITMQALAPACTAIFTGVLLSGMPECEISSMALKSVVETLLKVTVDIRAGVPCPDSQHFFDLIIWRRDSNLAQSAGLPYDSASKLYSEYKKNLWKALTTFNVRVASDLTISYSDDSNGTMSNSTRGSASLSNANKTAASYNTTSASSANSTSRSDAASTTTESNSNGASHRLQRTQSYSLPALLSLAAATIVSVTALS